MIETLLFSKQVRDFWINILKLFEGHFSKILQALKFSYEKFKDLIL